MKVKLLKKIKRQNVILKRNNEYKYICLNKTRDEFGDIVYSVNTDWTTDLQYLLEIRRKQTSSR